MKSISRRKAGNGTSFVVYLIQSENGLTKIGIATDVQNRLQTLNIGSPVELYLIYHVYTVYAREIEIELHDRYSSQRVKGEWHKLSDNDIADIQEKYGPNGTISEYAV